MATKPDKLIPNDPRTQKKSTTVNGRKWSYTNAPLPSSQQQQQKGTIILLHGFPDISHAWRYQIPLFLSLGFRCIALDCMGYSDTGYSSNLRDYTFKAHAEAVRAIVREEGIRGAVIGGHDWGGIAVYRVAQWLGPEVISCIFSVCTAFVPVVDSFVPTEQLARTTIPQFGYQLQFGSADGQIERVVKDEASMRRFLKGMYGGKVKSKKQFMTPEKGIDLSIIESEEDDVGPSPLFDDAEFEHYVKEFCKNDIRGPCNWYRTRKMNFEDEQKMPADVKTIIKQPTLYVLATQDAILTRDLAKNMEKNVPNLTRGEVNAGHWALWQTPSEVNAILKDWIEGVVLGGKSKL